MHIGFAWRIETLHLVAEVRISKDETLGNDTIPQYLLVVIDIP